MSLAVKAGMAKRPATALQRLGRLRAPSGHFIPESHLNELARMLDCTSAVSGFRVRRIGINDSVWLVTCPANPEGWMIKKVPAHRRYSGVPTDVENCDALIRKFPGIVDDQRLAFPHSVVEIHSLSAPWSSEAGDHVADLLVSRRVPGDQLGVYLAELDLAKPEDQTALEEVCAGVGEMLADFHARYADPVTGEATYHTDFHPSNVLYEKKTGTLSIVDLTGMGNPGASDDVEKFERLMFGMAGERYALAFRHRYLAMAKTSACKTDRSCSKSTVASSTDAMWAVPSFHLPAPPTRATGSFKMLSLLAVPESGFNPDKHLTTLAFMLSPSRACEPQLIPLSPRAKAWVLCQGSTSECWVVQQAGTLFAERCEEFIRQCPEVLEDTELAFPHSAIPLQANQKQLGSLLVADCPCRTTLEQYATTLDQTTTEDEAKLHKVLHKIGETLSDVLARYVIRKEADEGSPRTHLQLRPGNVLYDPATEAIAFADFSWPGDANAISASDRLYDAVKSIAGLVAAEVFQKGYQSAQRSRRRLAVSETSELFQFGTAFCQSDPGSEAEAVSSGSESEDDQREKLESEQCSLM